MNKKTGSYQIIDFPAERRAMPAFLELKVGEACHVCLAGGGCHGRQEIYRGLQSARPVSSFPSPVTWLSAWPRSG